MAPLTLAHELALLGYDDAGVNQLGRPTLDYGLAGALLLELTLAGRVEVADDRLVVTDPTPVGQRQLDDALTRIATEPKRRKPKDWVSRLAKDLPEQVLDGLVTAGVLRRDSDKVLWIFPRTRYPSTTGAEPAVETQARQRMVAAVAADGPVDGRTAALIGLVRAVGLDRKLFAELPKEHVKRRLTEIAAGDWASAATKKAIEEIQAVILITTTTAVTTTIITTTS
ncbi:GOLPH3/VPS74 family protein [Micromonospora sp. DT46]|uniref:GOLPH3/VPS74 family protein n=1 Tax=unclassified Micromonospora TaxID=2617518 RepID=UPI00124B662D|nr:GPP34 family phosphoprotein [Micromonospora sp. AMSO12t]KAB1155958.1 GPP34 family phosphoprotein [Micromonospora sp. AMSO12t]